MTQDEIVADLLQFLPVHHITEDVIHDVILAYLERAESVRTPRGWCLKRARWRMLDIILRDLRQMDYDEHAAESRVDPLQNPLRRVATMQRLDRYVAMRGKDSPRWRYQEDYRVLKRQDP